MLRSLLLASAVFLFASLAAGADSCPVTTAPDPPFVPPKAYTQEPPPGTFWYGTEALWTARPVDGHWLGSLADDGYRQKLLFWRKGFDWRTEMQPELTITGWRRDGYAPTVSVDQASAVFLGGTSSIMTAAGISAGCWEITAHYRGETLIFIVSVP